MVIVSMVRGLRVRQDRLHFRGGDDRQHAGEEQDQGEEDPEGAQEHAEVHHGGLVDAPGGGQEVLVQRDHDDHEALEPHADGDADGHQDHPEVAGAGLPEPEDLGDEDVAADGDPAGPAVGAGDDVHEAVVEELVHGVPGREALHHVAVAHDAAHGEDHLVHHIQVPHGDEVLQLHGLAHHHQHHHHHGETGEDGARHEVGREDGHVPAGHHRGGEVEAHHRVHGE